MRRKGYSLLELVVVLAIMGTLAAIAVPVYSNVTDNSSTGALQSSADGIAKSANSRAQSDPLNPGRGTTINDIVAAASDEDVELLAGATSGVRIYGQKDLCINVSITGSASDSVAVSGDPYECLSGSPATTSTTAPTTTTTVAPTTYAYTITAGDLGGYGSCAYPSGTTATFYCIGGATATGLAAFNSLAPGDTIEISWCDNSSNGCNNNGSGPVVSETLTYTIASVSTPSGEPWRFTTTSSMPAMFGPGGRSLVGMRM